MVVVSEETGTVSITRNGEIYRYLRRDDVVDMLQSAVMAHHNATIGQMIKERIEEYRSKRNEKDQEKRQITKTGGKS